MKNAKLKLNTVEEIIGYLIRRKIKSRPNSSIAGLAREITKKNDRSNFNKRLLGGNLNIYLMTISETLKTDFYAIYSLKLKKFNHDITADEREGLYCIDKLMTGVATLDEQNIILDKLLNYLDKLSKKSIRYSF